ncbi:MULTISPECIES: DUF309 domain-containing protein [unclassified Bacillus cereus group]|uniref:DUF309 domain-containing protein n=1 Tax=unclassified Bacillus cereus group TaxID=2750818 RepID=UPI001F5A865B|nr:MULTISPECIES: DUF309 domain-containing protein [unclassified Bacillus cereus group]
MYPKAYIQFLIHFHGDYDYFECHEVLEEYWKLKPRGKRDHHWVGLIQIAVSLYHQRRLNWNGAAKMMKGAISSLEKEREHIHTLGLHHQQLLILLKKQLQSIQKKEGFQPLFLPFLDPTLENRCIDLCAKSGLSWKNTHLAPSEYIIHKHTLRNREHVIAERHEQLKKRKQR